jgi:hypothetical protein
VKALTQIAEITENSTGGQRVMGRADELVGRETRDERRYGTKLSSPPPSPAAEYRCPLPEGI